MWRHVTLGGTRKSLRKACHSPLPMPSALAVKIDFKLRWIRVPLATEIWFLPRWLIVGMGNSCAQLYGNLLAKSCGNLICFHFAVRGSNKFSSIYHSEKSRSGIKVNKCIVQSRRHVPLCWARRSNEKSKYRRFRWEKLSRKAANKSARSFALTLVPSAVRKFICN